MLMAAARTINGDKHKIPFFIPDRRMPLRTTMTHAIHWCTTNVNCRAIGRFHEYYELWILINSHPPTPYAYAKHIPNNLHLNGKLKFNIRQKLHTPHVSMHTNKQPLHNHIRCRRIYTIYIRFACIIQIMSNICLQYLCQRFVQYSYDKCKWMNCRTLLAIRHGGRLPRAIYTRGITNARWIN